MKRKYISQDPDSGQTYPAMQENKTKEVPVESFNLPSGKLSQHTPTPWTATKFGDTKATSLYADGGTVSLGNIKSKDDAEFIVSAVNSHEALLEAAKLMKGILKENRNFTPDEFKQVQSAIAQAEGKP